MTLKIKPTNRGVKTIATRAANEFEIGRGENSANAYVSEDGTVNVSTTAAGGDNVPWATKLLNRVASRIAIRYGLEIDWKSQQHCSGNCSIKLKEAA